MAKFRQRIQALEAELAQLKWDLRNTEDAAVERNRWFDGCGVVEDCGCDNFVHIAHVLSEEYCREQYAIECSNANKLDIRAAEVLVERANALRGVGRPDKVPELLREMHAGEDVICTQIAFDNIQYQPPEDD